jgi:hypothetical protein
MKGLLVYAVIAVLLTGCGMTAADVESTIAALPSEATATPEPTQTPWIIVVTATGTSTSEYTPTPSQTPTITFTPSITPNVEQTSAARQQATETARLTSPKGDGFYLVGIDIAMGTWRSTAGYEGCYWSLNDKQGDINDNHFGDSGGTVHIRASDYEVQFDDCGQWTYLGP